MPPPDNRRGPRVAPAMSRGAALRPVSAPRRRPEPPGRGTTLRLAGGPAAPAPGPTPEGPSLGTPIRSATDPRWVVAVRTAEQLQGTLLPPESRGRLLRLGRLLGLTDFDTNLVIAIVQDQARRGHEPAACPTAGEAQLRMVPLGTRGRATQWTRPGRSRAAALLLAALIAAEIALLLWWV